MPPPEIDAARPALRLTDTCSTPYCVWPSGPSTGALVSGVPGLEQAAAQPEQQRARLHVVRRVLRAELDAELRRAALHGHRLVADGDAEGGDALVLPQGPRELVDHQLRGLRRERSRIALQGDVATPSSLTGHGQAQRQARRHERPDHVLQRRARLVEQALHQGGGDLVGRDEHGLGDQDAARSGRGSRWTPARSGPGTSRRGRSTRPARRRCGTRRPPGRSGSASRMSPAPRWPRQVPRLSIQCAPRRSTLTSLLPMVLPRLS